MIITRFAPSPTGNLHLGNARIAIINWLFTKKNNGKFILRIDDTNITNNIYIKSILDDLKWLGITCDIQLIQSTRKQRYNEIKHILINNNMLYPCYETEQELLIQQKKQILNKKPTIYSREALNISNKQIQIFKKEGRKPYYRFFIKKEKTFWHDIIHQKIQFNNINISDPIIIRSDGSFTYLLSSIIDDIDYNITHIIRGNDHIYSTLIQIQMLNTLKYQIPLFGHLPLITSSYGKLSKKNLLNTFHVKQYQHLEPMTVNSFITLLGTSTHIFPIKNIMQLMKIFNISKYTKRNIIINNDYNLHSLNKKMLTLYTYNDTISKLKILKFNILINNKFWIIIKNNIQYFYEIYHWYCLLYNTTYQTISKLNLNTIKILLIELKKNISFKTWITNVCKQTQYKKKIILITLRQILINNTSGPKIQDLFYLLNNIQIKNKITKIQKNIIIQKICRDREI